MYSIDNTIGSLKKALSNNFRVIENWFHEKLMVLNAKKCHGMCLENVSENDDFIFDGIELSNSCKGKILDVIIDNDLKFDPHVRSMCEKSSAEIRSAKQNFFIIRPWKKTCIQCSHKTSL